MGNRAVIHWNWITFCLLHKAVQLQDPSGIPTYVKCIKKKLQRDKCGLNLSIC